MIRNTHSARGSLDECQNGKVAMYFNAVMKMLRHSLGILVAALLCSSCVAETEYGYYDDYGYSYYPYYYDYVYGYEPIYPWYTGISLGFIEHGHEHGEHEGGHREMHGTEGHERMGGVSPGRAGEMTRGAVGGGRHR